MAEPPLADDLQRTVAALTSGQLGPHEIPPILERPEAVAPLLLRLDASTAEVVVPQLARIGARILAQGDAADDRARDALAQVVSTVVAMAGGALPLKDETLLAALGDLGDTGVAALQRRLLQAPPHQVGRLRALLVELGHDAPRAAVQGEPAARPAPPPTPLQEPPQRPTEALPAPVADTSEPPVRQTPQPSSSDEPPARPQDVPAVRAEPSVRPAAPYTPDDASPEQPDVPSGRDEPPALPTALAALTAAIDAAVAATPDTAESASERIALIGRLTQEGTQPLSHAHGDETDAIAEALVDALSRDPAPNVRRAAAAALADLGARAAVALDRRLDSEIRIALQNPADAQPRAGTRTDLLLAAARIDHPPALQALLQALVNDPIPTVRRAAAGALRVRATRQPAAVRATLTDALDAAISPELAALLLDLQPDLVDELLADLAAEDQRRQGRAIAALATLAAHDDDLAGRIAAILDQPDRRARRAAAETLERLGAIPEEPERAVAYHLARGRIEACRGLGTDALPALRAACAAYDWHVSGPAAIAMLKLGLDPDDPLLDQVDQELAAAAALPDGALVRTISPPVKGGAERRSLQLTIAHDQERQAAQELLFRLQRIRARLVDRRNATRTG